MRLKPYLVGVVSGTMIAAALLAAAMTVSAHGGDTTRVHACVNQSSGTIKIISPTETCKGNDVALDWNVKSDPGAPGPQGIPGPKGDQGIPGPPGAFNGVLSSPNGAFKLSVTNDGIEMLGPSGTILVGSSTIAIKASSDLTVTATRDLLTTVGRDETSQTGRNKTETVSGAQVETVTLSKSETAGSKTETYGTTLAISVGGAMTETVGSSQSVSVGTNRTESIGGAQSLTVGSNKTESVSGNSSAITAGTVEIKGTGNVVVDSTQNQLSLNGRRVSVDGDLDVAVQATTNVNVQAASNINIQAQGNLHLQGSTITQN